MLSPVFWSYLHIVATLLWRALIQTAALSCKGVLRAAEQQLGGCFNLLKPGIALVDWLGLHGQTPVHRVLRIALGATFDALDFVAYGLGCWLCLATARSSRPGYRPQRAAWP